MSITGNLSDNLAAGAVPHIESAKITVDGTDVLLKRHNYFTGKPTSENPAVQELASGVWKNTVWVDTSFVYTGDFTYDMEDVTYIGPDNVMMSISASASVSSADQGVTTHMGLWIDGAIDYGLMAAAKIGIQHDIKQMAFTSSIMAMNGMTFNMRSLADDTTDISMRHFTLTIFPMWG